MSLRAAQTLVSADYILAEDTRTFNSFYKNIQTLFNLKPEKQQKIIHFHKENEFERIPQVLQLLKEGKEIALVSESGMPLISDPGSVLLQHVIKNKFPYTVIPGPTAFVNGLILSGFPTERVLFLGFLPKKTSRVSQLFSRFKTEQLTVIFYESPHRINETLELLHTVLPDADICICREMTKKFEEVIRGKARELLNRKYKGEITVMLTVGCGRIELA